MEWSFFVKKWSQYKSACQFEGARELAELHACCSNSISRSLSQGGETYSSDGALMLAIKKLAVHGHSALVQQFKFMQIKQSPGERFVKYLSRLKGASSDSGFVITCKEASNPCCEAEDGIRDPLWSRGLGDVYKRQVPEHYGHARLAS